MTCSSLAGLNPPLDFDINDGPVKYLPLIIKYGVPVI